MDKIISYSFFDAKQLYPHRFWDQHRFDALRYWYNIPAVFIMRHLLFEDYQIRFYINPNLRNHPMFNLLAILNEEIPSFSIVDVTDDYVGHEAALWRLKPLWEDYDTVLSRDIDSIASINEYFCVKEFEESECCISTIRGHENHYGHGCSMLIGLSAFKPRAIGTTILTCSWEEFLSTYSVGQSWDLDQRTIINAFTNPEFTKEKFLDCPIQNQKNPQTFPCKTVSATHDASKLSAKQSAFFSIVKEFGLSEWAGQPCDTRGQCLMQLIPFYPVIGDIIKTLDLEGFYVKS